MPQEKFGPPALDEDLSSVDISGLYDSVSVAGAMPPWAGQYPPRVVPVKRTGFRVWVKGEEQPCLDAHQAILSMSEGWRHIRIENAIEYFRDRYPGVDMVDTTQLSPQATLLLRDLKEALKPYGNFRGLLASSGTIANNQAIATCMGSLGGEESTQLIVMEGCYGGRDLMMNALCTAPGWQGVTSLKSIAERALVVKRDGSNLEDVLSKIPDGKRPLWHTEDGIQGVGGFYPYSPELMRKLAEEVKSRGGRMILDNVQTFVRNGAGLIGADMWRDPENPNHNPDAVVFAKGLGNGYPVAVAMIAEDVLEACKHNPGNTFDTFSQPLTGVVAARVVLKLALDEKQWEGVAAQSARFKSQTADFPDRFSGVVEEIVGEGGMVGLRLRTPQQAVEALRIAPSHGVLFAKGGKGDVLRTPLPFNVTDAFVDELCEKLASVMKSIKDRGI